MRKKTNFIKLIRLWGIVLFTALAVVIICIEIVINYRDFNYRTEKMRIDFVEQQKQRIKCEVDCIVDVINHERAQSEVLAKTKIKSKGYEAYGIVQNVYEQNKMIKSDTDMQKMIVDLLRPIRFNNGKGYYFINSLSGENILYPPLPSFEGQNIINLQDSKGEYIVKKEVKLLREKGEGFVTGYWTKPFEDSTKDFKKIAFVKLFKPYDWSIGAVLYLDDIEKQIKAKFISHINKISFDKNRYMFVDDWKGMSIAHGAQPDLIGTDMWEFEDSKGTKTTQSLIAASKKEDGGYVSYWWRKPDTGTERPKIAYAKGVPEWELFVATGVYIDDIEQDIATLHAALNTQTKTKIFIFVIIVVTAFALFLFFFNWMNNRLIKDVNLFISFFDRAAYSDKNIDHEAVHFVELDQMAEYANKMLKDKLNAQQDLLDEKELLFVTIRSIGDGVITTDTSGRVKLMNMVAEQLTGWNQDKASGKMLSEVFNIINEKTRKTVKNPVDTVLAKGHIVGLLNNTILVSKNGTEYNIADSASPIRDRKSDIIGIVLVFRDISELYIKDKKICENEQFLNSIFKSVQDGISILDTELTILHVNEVMNKWYSGNVPLEGKKCFKCYQNIDKPCNPCPSMRCLESGKTEMDVMPGMPGSDVEWIELYSYPIRNPASGEITGIVEFVKDITGRKKAEQELLKSKRLESIGVLAGGIAHDFNNILAGLFGNIELAKMKLSRNHKAYPHIEIANQALERAAHLTKQLLTFAKGGAPILDAVDLKSIVQTTVKFNLSGSNVKVHFNLPDDLWQIKADKEQISQVIANLTINAKQAMPDGGNLYINAETVKTLNKTPVRDLSGNLVKLSIRDEGTGISPKHIEKIFDPYFSTKQTGSGLGLATVYSIITKHNGRISVDSIPDVGTTFTILFQAETSFHKQTDTNHPVLTEKPKPSSCRILVMDDEEIVRNVTGAMLELCGCTASFSSDGKDAVEKYTSAYKSGNPFDVVIMDLTIPGGIGGREAVRNFFAIDPKAKMIVSSGYSTDPVMANYSEYGFKGRLVKPFQMEELKKELFRVMEIK